jgi:hypothetical protein
MNQQLWPSDNDSIAMIVEWTTNHIENNLNDSISDSKEWLSREDDFSDSFNEDSLERHGRKIFFYKP